MFLEHRLWAWGQTPTSAGVKLKRDKGNVDNSELSVRVSTFAVFFLFSSPCEVSIPACARDQLHTTVVSDLAAFFTLPLSSPTVTTGVL